MNYLEEEMDGEAMINSIQNGDHPLPVVAHVSLAETAPNAIPTLKDPNNEAAKDLWDAIERQMRGSEYGEQDRKAAILYEYENFKATEGGQLLDIYFRYLQVINDLKKLYDSFDENNLFIFDDESVRNSQVRKIPFRKKPNASLNVPSRSKLNKSFPRIVHNWLPKLQPLAEPVDKWIPKIVQICLWIINSGYSKHMTGNRALLINFMEKFLGTVRFSNNDFAMITGYGDVGLEVAFRKSTCFVRTEDGVDLLTGDRSSNLYTSSLNKVASNSLACLLRTASSSQSWLWHQRLSHLNFAIINNLVKNNLVRRCYLLNDYDDVGKLKVKGDIGVFVGYSKESAAFRIYNKRTRKIHESMNVNFDKILEMASKQVILEPGLSNLNETGKSSNPSVSQVSEKSKKDLEDLFQNFYDEYFDSKKVMKSLTTNVETSNVKIPLNEEEVFHESSESFQEESSSSSLNDDVQQRSTSQNMFNEHLEDAYFDASTSFHDPSNVHTFYQHYPHEKKWTKDHPFHKIIGDPKSSVRTRGQLANSCLFSCFLSSIGPANVAEALRDADWVSAMQEELDQFARLKVWRLFPRPEGKTIIKTKWIFKNKKDESSLFLIDSGFQNDKIDTTLFIKKKGEMKFFLGLQVNQFLNRIFINQSKYVLDILKRFGMENCDTVSTPMVEQAKLKLDLVGKPVNHTDYHSMIGSLMYVTSSRTDIMFATCMCARYQENPNEHHVSVIKRTFRYLKGTINLGIWYPKDSSFDLTVYSDADHAGCHLDRKSTSGSVQFLGDKLVCWSSEKQNCVSISTPESEYVVVSGCCAQVL
nr:hypothetical protein [Tanacetum cinerariifolium]GEX82276.1 hypothetical protein [Tanacetum cinerariifolium]